MKHIIDFLETTASALENERNTKKQILEDSPLPLKIWQQECPVATC